MSKNKTKGISGLLQSQKNHKFKDTSFIWCEQNKAKEISETIETREAKEVKETKETKTINNEEMSISFSNTSPITDISITNFNHPIPANEVEIKTKLEHSWSKIGEKLQQKKMLS
ncbi:MAG: hypothetical protein HQK49_04530 [Oligoflexia bacterium]|nr:hypothetical protein [Oligoflexia bacterium]